MLNNPQISPASYPQRVASVAAKKENASEFKWLFDFDEKKELIPEFISDIKNESNLTDEEIEFSETVTGFAVVVKHGFDTRNLLKKWKNVELKRDDMLLVDFLKNI